MLPPYELFPIKVYENGILRPFKAPVVYEKEVEVILNGQPVKTVACSPGAYEELGIGLLLSEGMINRQSQILSVDCSQDGKILIMASDPDQAYTLVGFARGNCFSVYTHWHRIAE